MSTVEQIIAEHRIVEGPHKHQTVWVAWVRCRCGWRSERTPNEPLHWAEPELLEELRGDHAAHVVAALTNAGHIIVEADRLFELANNPVQAERDGTGDEPSLVKFGAVPVERLRWMIVSSIIGQSPAAARVAEGSEFGE